LGEVNSTQAYLTQLPIPFCMFCYISNMKKLLIISAFSLSVISCVSIRFPETIKVDITIPEDFNIEKVQVIIDTLRGYNKNGKNKINGVFEFKLHKADSIKEKAGREQKGIIAPR